MSPFSCNGFGLLTPSLTGPNSHREVGGAARLGVGERHAPAAAVLLSCYPAVLLSCAASAPPHSMPAHGVLRLLPVCVPSAVAGPVDPSSTLIFSLHSDTAERMKKQDTGENICET